MSTDLFNNFWSNPSKQYVYTDLTCANAKSEDELSFNINDGAGEISDNNSVLSSIDLSNISTSLSSFSNSSKVLPAKSLLYIGSESYGKSYKKIVFGKISDSLLNDIDWQSYTNIKFVISWIRNNNCPCKLLVEAQGTEDKDVIDVINDILVENNINVTASFITIDSKDYNLLSFVGGKSGYEFYVDNVSYYISNIEENEFINEDLLSETPMEEVSALYVPAYKYRNGAFKGIVITPTYPMYNNDINEEVKSLQLCHIKDRISVFVKNHRGDYFKKNLNVFGNHFDINEFNSCILFVDKNDYINDDLEDMWLNDDNDEWVTIENGYNVLRNSYCGLYGYANYATVNNLWTNFGDVYMVLANRDDISNANNNLLTPVILYNPNEFDVKVNVLTLEE